MRTQGRNALFALAAAGALWGLTVPLSKLSLGWLGPGWLTVVRFAVATPLLALAGRRGLRQALAPRVAASGAIGFGAVIMLQNAGIQRTSTTHAAVLIGAVPVLVALIAAALGQAKPQARGWAGHALALGGVALVAGAAGGAATPRGDLLVLASAALSAALIVIQPQLLAGRDAAAVTAVQFAAGALVALPIAIVSEGIPAAPVKSMPVIALVALATIGTPLPFWLFAHGQARVSAQLAGAFTNLEPIVGVALGWAAFGNPAAIQQITGAMAVLAGISLNTLPTIAGEDEGPCQRTQPARRAFIRSHRRQRRRGNPLQQSQPERSRLGPRRRRGPRSHGAAHGPNTAGDHTGRLELAATDRGTRAPRAVGAGRPYSLRLRAPRQASDAERR